MSVVDSSGWVEYLSDSGNADSFAEQLEKIEELVVPTIVIVEVRRWIMAHGHSSELDQATALMTRARVVNLDSTLAQLASTLGIRHRLPLADSIVYATAQSLGLELWTQDKDFDGLPDVRYVDRLSAAN
ncbi:MAG TPA: type II toxin-antitoxin system VapC family toxin [Tepidiformaceae bacterium]|nr:type II toxin-antitoxin system VapC family toxin [Tepidiformaceae bacterium]